MGYLWTHYALDCLVVSLLFVHRPALLFPSAPALPFILPSVSVRTYCPPRSQKSEVKKTSLSCRMKGIKTTFIRGETHDGLYYTETGEQRRPRAASQGHAIALRGLRAGGGWQMCTWETV